jgi:hypothetical protein
VRDSIPLQGLPPHGSAVLRLTPEGEGPILLGSNVHISQGAAELVSARRTDRGVILELSSPARPMPGAMLVLRLPAGRLKAPDGVEVTDLGGSVYRLEFKLEGTRRLELTW